MYEKLIDEILDRMHEDVHIEKGCGRLVYIFDDVVVKVPRNHCEEDLGGIAQNKEEFKIYTETKSDILCPILEEYKDCIVMKRLESNPNVLMEKIDSNNFNNAIYEIYSSEINKLVKEYNLNLTDLVYVNNWGYDYDDDKFKCIDYGYAIRNMNLF